MMEFMRFSQPAHLVLLLPMAVVFWLVWKRRSAGGALSERTASPRRFPVLRAMTLVLIVVALSSIQVRFGRRRTALVFVLDRSESVSRKEESAALDFMNRTAHGMAAEDEAGVVVFGKEALIEQPLRRNLVVSEIQSTPGTASTNVARGLGLARTMLGGRPDASKHIILLSDGNQNAGDALQEAALAAAQGIIIDVLPLGTASEVDGRRLFLDEVSGPDRVRLGEPFNIRIALRADEGARVQLKLYRDTALIAEQGETMGASGSGAFQIEERLSSPGLHQYRVTAQNADNALSSDSDEAGLVVYSFGTTRILHLSLNPTPFLDAILKRQGFDVVTNVPGSAPKTAQEAEPYDAVILDDAPAGSFTDDQMRVLADYVEKSGGGLIMTGGAASFGPGGFSGTPVERVLPVEMALRKREKKPALSVVLVIDKSGSMGMEQRKVSKLDMAKDAVLRLSDLLTPEDALGIIAFDRVPQPVLPLHQGIDRNGIDASLRRLVAGGGTAILPAVKMAYQWLGTSVAEKKYVLLLSDGQAEPGERKPLLDMVSGSPIVLSAVGIGADVDQDFMKQLAQSSHGRSYFTQSGTDLPDIFKREAMLISGSWLVDRRFKPKQTADHEILRNLGQAGFPELSGYVATTPKNLADVPLTADSGDPILACWRYGLGKSLVFATDFGTPWTRVLVSWEYFARMWAQMVRWTSRDVQNERLHPTVLLKDDAATLVVDAFDPDGRFLNMLKFAARVQAPDGKTQDIDLKQTASGRYEARFDLRGKGAYLFSAVASGPGPGAGDSLHFGFNLSRFPEDKQQTSDRPFLATLADKTNGRILEQTGTPALEAARTSGYSDAWQIAVLAALLLFVLDIADQRGFVRKRRFRMTV
jgi:Mg-chelatase subunit ChlD